MNKLVIIFMSTIFLLSCSYNENSKNRQIDGISIITNRIQVRGRFEIDGTIEYRPKTINNSMLFVSTYKHKKYLYCVNVEDNGLKWKIQENIATDLVVHNNKVYFGTKDSEIKIFDTVDGKFISKFKCMSLPEIIKIEDDILYYQTDLKLYALSLFDNVMIWSIDYKLNTYLLDNDSIFVFEQNTIIKIEKSKGSYIGKYFCKETINGDNAVLYNNKLIFWCFDDSIKCIDTDKMSLNWEIHNYNYFDTKFVIANNNLFLSMRDYGILVIDPENGEILRKLELDRKSSYKGFAKQDNIYFVNAIGDQLFILNPINYSINKVEVELKTIGYFEPVIFNNLICLTSYDFKSNNKEDIQSTIVFYKKAAETLIYHMDNCYIYNDGELLKVNYNPISFVNNEYYISVKDIIAPLGGKTAYNRNEIIDINNSDKTKSKYYYEDEILVKLLNYNIKLVINNSTATLNGKQVQIDPKNPKITPIIINGRTMVPLRFLAESLGCKVEWKADTKEIIVTYQP